jgi:hypothetical protein
MCSSNPSRRGGSSRHDDGSRCPLSGRVPSIGSQTTRTHSLTPRTWRSAQPTAEQLPGVTVEAVAGEADVGLAIRDALATFAADEIVVALRPEDEEGPSSRRRRRRETTHSRRSAPSPSCDLQPAKGRNPATCKSAAYSIAADSARSGGGGAGRVSFSPARRESATAPPRGEPLHLELAVDEIRGLFGKAPSGVESRTTQRVEHYEMAGYGIERTDRRARPRRSPQRPVQR